MTKYTRTNGANAQAQSWADFEEQRPQRTGSWLPLDALDEQAYEAGPQLRAMPSAPPVPRRSLFPPRQPRPAEVQPTTAHPASGQAPAQNARSASGQAGAQAKAAAILLGGALSVLAVYAAVSA